MSGWNYRVVKHDEDPDPERHWVAMHEIWYDKDGKMDGWSEGPILPLGAYDCSHDGRVDLIKELEQMLKEAREHEPLSMKEMKAQFPDPRSRSTEEETDYDDGGL